MKIAINTLSVVPGKVGGTETFLVNLVKNLVNIDDKNEFFLIVSCNNKKTFGVDSTNVAYIEFNFDNNSRIIRIFFEQAILPRRLKKERVDLLIAPGNTGLLYSPCKIMVVIQSMLYFIYPHFFPAMKRAYLQKLVKYSCKKASKVITVSNYMKDNIQKYTGIDDSKIDIIYEGVDYEFFRCNTKKALNHNIVREYKINNCYIFSPTSLYSYKNYDQLIKAFAVLKHRKGLSHKLVIAGLDPYKAVDKLNNLIQKHNLCNEVIYIGAVPYDHMPALYKGADLTVFLSSHESFGLPIIEAMASGCPVLSSNKSSLPEVVGDAGILVDPFDIEQVANKMNELLTNADLRSDCITKGLTRAREFSWENVAKRLIRIYNEFL